MEGEKILSTKEKVEKVEALIKNGERSVRDALRSVQMPPGTYYGYLKRNGLEKFDGRAARFQKPTKDISVPKPPVGKRERKKPELQTFEIKSVQKSVKLFVVDGNKEDVSFVLNSILERSLS